MIWLASFPRSGNTFFRNILFEVYGLESSTFHREANYPLDENYAAYPFVKTHLLPEQLPAAHRSAPKVYLVRDGRDTMVSLAHHRKDIIEPGTDYYTNLLEAILAAEGSYFGGWSENVRQWVAVADVVIRYEDLIEDPLREVEKLRAICDMPEPRRERLPTFEKLKFGKPQYGSGVTFLDEEKAVADLAQKNFRRGKSGAWKKEMPAELQELFEGLHGGMMQRMGYLPPAAIAAPPRPLRILVESNKLSDSTMDGVRRYQVELLQALFALQERLPNHWSIDCLVGESIHSLESIIHQLNEEENQEVTEDSSLATAQPSGYEQLLLRVKAGLANCLPLSVYHRLSKIYTQLPARSFLSWLRMQVNRRKARAARQRINEAYDLIHVPLPQNYYFIQAYSLPVVGTVHDLTHAHFPEFHEPHNVRLSEAGMQFFKDKAAALIAVSESTGSDVQENYGIPPDRIAVIYEAANGDLFHPVEEAGHLRAAREKYGIPDGPYFLCLSTIEPRKNLQHTLAAFLRLKREPGMEGLRIVVCGKKGWKVRDLYDEADPHASHICFTGYVADEDLAALYSGALALCYAAFYEGFGLPPLEAMLCGTPVLYGNNSAMPEVVQDGGLGVDPGCVEDIQAGMKRLVESKALQQELSAAALRRARRFSWLRTGFETLMLYKQTINQPRT